MDVREPVSPEFWAAPQALVSDGRVRQVLLCAPASRLPAAVVSRWFARTGQRAHSTPTVVLAAARTRDTGVNGGTVRLVPAIYIYIHHQ